MNRGAVFLAGVVTGALALGLLALGWKTQVTVVPSAPVAVEAPSAGPGEFVPPQESPVPVTPAPEDPAPVPAPALPPVPVAVPVELPPETAPPPVSEAPDAGPMPVLALIIPVEGIAAAQLSDTFKDARGENRRHDAIDIMAPTGTPVLAVADGRIVKFFNSEAGGLTIYQFDEDETVAFYYAHLDRYADGVAEGQAVKQGDVLGYVGYSGNASANAPHLHFAIFVMGAEKNWWQGRAINPYPYLRR